MPALPSAIILLRVAAFAAEDTFDRTWLVVAFCASFRFFAGTCFPLTFENFLATSPMSESEAALLRLVAVVTDSLPEMLPSSEVITVLSEESKSNPASVTMAS